MSTDRCTVCGLRLAQAYKAKLYIFQEGIMSVRIYMANSTEPLCFGHEQQQKEEVPAVFQDAFDSDFEL